MSHPLYSLLGDAVIPMPAGPSQGLVKLPMSYEVDVTEYLTVTAVTAGAELL